MEKTRKHFSQDYLISVVRKAISDYLSSHDKEERTKGRIGASSTDCVMLALAMFVFKSPSMLKFESVCRSEPIIKQNLKNLFRLREVLSDSQMRERVDKIPPSAIRRAFSRIFALLQRGHLLDYFKFIDNSYLISLDGTGYFSSRKVHCEQCCIKQHRDGSKEYYHQLLSGALVHYEQKAVYPLAPEAILKQDGVSKNDCERNAAKRWLAHFRREHPHLPVTIVADGLSSNQPFIELLRQYKMNYILVCREADHKYLLNWIEVADANEAPCIERDGVKVTEKYQYMHNVPLNSKHDLTVNVLRYWEKNKRTNKVSKWIWVTNFKITEANMKQLMRGGRARWRIENETFNTLKNQGYNFEHNYGHGYKNLSTTLAFLMMLTFLMDQTLQAVNKLFSGAYARLGTKYTLWEYMRVFLSIFRIPSFEHLYQAINHPPPSAALTL